MSMGKPRFADAERYAMAIKGALREAPHKHQELLVAHLLAPGHAQTYGQLAKAVGYAHYGSVNLQYGTLARRVAERLGIFERPPEGFWGIVLVDWTGDYDPSGTQFRLRPEVVKALRSLGLADSSRSNKAVQPTSRAREMRTSTGRAPRG